MKNTLGLKHVKVIPNGVDLNNFQTIDQNIARIKMNYNPKKKYIVWIALPSRYSKNLDLAKEALYLIETTNVEIKVLYNIPQEDIPYHLNAANMLLLTSRWEGSPNIIKEAMACNCPIVSTKVGDVEWLLNGIEGCYIADFDAAVLANKIEKALEFSERVGRTKGRDRLIELKLDTESVAQKLIEIYQDVLDSN